MNINYPDGYAEDIAEMHKHLDSSKRDSSGKKLVKVSEFSEVEWNAIVEAIRRVGWLESQGIFPADLERLSADDLAKIARALKQ